MVTSLLTPPENYNYVGLLGPSNEPDDGAAWPLKQDHRTKSHSELNWRPSAEARTKTSISPPSGNTPPSYLTFPLQASPVANSAFSLINVSSVPSKKTFQDARALVLAGWRSIWPAIDVSIFASREKSMRKEEELISVILW